MTITPEQPGGRPPRRRLRPLAAVLLTLLTATLVVVVALVAGPARSPVGVQATALATNPNLDPGTALSGRAPDFTLTDQFGQRVSLHDYRGKVVILAFNDAQCTTVCPLTTTTMLEARGLLGTAASGVALVGVNANPTATARRWVRSYSQAHGMLHQWRFLTGSTGALRTVWRQYHIEAQIDRGQIDHTPALYVIDGRGRLAEVYLTQMAYATMGQQAQVLAREVASLLPGRPAVRSSASYARIPPIGPATHVTLARAGGGSVRLGPGSSPRLVLFFATWLTATTNLGPELAALDRYQSAAPAKGLPSLVAVDEASVEPSAAALPAFLRGLPSALSYPVGIDRTGRVADGYEVQDQPWFVLASRSGQILWYWDATTQGWPTTAELERHVRAALSAPPRAAVPTPTQASRLLADSPPALAALHRQGGMLLLGSDAALAARLKALRGYPVVLNAWASWCGPCRQEYPLFASASVRYGRRVAFLGADIFDPISADARSWLAGHPLSYPSYQSGGGLPQLNGIEGPPDTIFIDGAGHITSVHIGIYDSQGTLDADIASYALGQ